MNPSHLQPLDDFLARYMEHGQREESWGHYHVLDTRVSLRRLQSWMKKENLKYSELNWNKLQGLHRWLTHDGVSIGRCLRAVNHSQRALRWGVEQGELPQKLTDIYVFHFQRHAWDEALPEQALEFLSQIEATLVAQSVTSHRYSLRVFHTFLREKKLTYRKLRRENLIDYIKYLNEKKFYQNGRSQLVMRSRVYIRWLFEQGKIARSADELIPSRLIPRPKKGLPRPLEPELDIRLQTLLRETDDLCYKAILLMRYTGIRVGELRELSFSCIEGKKPDQASLRVPPVKLGIERLVPLDADIVSLIEDIQRRSKENNAGKDPSHLVVLRNGTRPNYDRLREPMTEICARLNTNRWINLHSLRHTFATSLLNAGLNILTLKEILGHKTIIMTLVYAKLAQVKLREDYREALEKMTQSYVPACLQETAPTARNAASIEEAFQNLQSLMRRQMDGADSHQHSQQKAQFVAILARLSKIKYDLLRITRSNPRS